MNFLINIKFVLLLVFSWYKRLAGLGVGDPKVALNNGYVSLIAIFINTQAILFILHKTELKKNRVVLRACVCNLVPFCLVT
jgi:hypothetical protein